MLKKAVIIYNEAIAEGYMENGNTGIVVQYGDKTTLKEKIHELHNLSQRRKKLGEEAFKWVNDARLNQKEWVDRVYNIAAAEYYRRVDRFGRVKHGARNR